MERTRRPRSSHPQPRKNNGTLFDSIIKVVIVQSVICALLLLSAFVVKIASADLYEQIKTAYEKEASVNVGDSGKTSESEKLLSDIVNYIKSVFSIKPISGSESSSSTSSNSSSGSSQSSGSSSSSSSSSSTSLSSGSSSSANTSNSSGQGSPSQSSAIGTSALTSSNLTATGATVNSGSVLSPPKGASFAPFLLLGAKVLPVTGKVTSPFGYRYSPFDKKPEFHYGLDISAPMGTEILAAFSGTVVDTGMDKSAGNYIKISHGSRTVVLYAHCSEVLVQTGDQVAAGDKIGLVGSTGASTGPHLHLQIEIDGICFDPTWVFPLTES